VDNRKIGSPKKKKKSGRKVAEKIRGRAAKTLKLNKGGRKSVLRGKQRRMKKD